MYIMRKANQPMTDSPRLMVLVAENEALVRLMVADELRELGFQVLEAVDAKEAMSILNAVFVDAVITDLHLRKLRDGMTVADHAHIQRPGVPVILASLEAPPVNERSLFDTFFVKPYQPKDIASWIKLHHRTLRPRQDSSAA
jgi:CheY-like chemotaxis protein